MKTEIQTDEYKRVGPYPDMFGHGPVTVICDPEQGAAELWVCLDCGYTAEDNRLFAHNGCDAEKNLINQSWREFIANTDENQPALPVSSNTSQFPIE